VGPWGLVLLYLRKIFFSNHVIFLQTWFTVLKQTLFNWFSIVFVNLFNPFFQLTFNESLIVTGGTDSQVCLVHRDSGQLVEVGFQQISHTP
jgi:hypothetical protein